MSPDVGTSRSSFALKRRNRRIVPEFFLKLRKLQGHEMQAAVDRVMQAYCLMVTLSPADEAQARERLEEHLRNLQGDEHALAIAGLRFLRDSDA